MKDLKNEVIVLKDCPKCQYSGFVIYDYRIAKTITYFAQVITRWMYKYLNLDIVYRDVDSIYVADYE